MNQNEKIYRFKATLGLFMGEVHLPNLLFAKMVHLGITPAVCSTLPDKYPRYQVQVVDDLAAKLVNNLQGG